MSIVNDVRKYADTALGTALDQGRAAPARAQELASGLGEDVRSRTLAAVTEVRGLTADLLEVARRQAFAALGASDLIVERLTKRAEELPADTARTAGRLADGARETAREQRQSLEAIAVLTRAVSQQAQAQVTAVANELRVRGEEAVGSARSFDLDKARTEVTGEFDSRLEEVRSRFDALADRGERVAAELRREPTVLRVMGNADDVAERAADQVVSLAESLRQRASANRRSVTGLKAAGSRARSPHRPAAVTAAKKASGATESAVRSAGDVAAATARTAGSAATSAAKTPARTSTGTKSTGRRSTRTEATARKATGTTGTGTKATARKATVRKATLRKTTLRKTTAGKATGTTAPARKTSAQKVTGTTTSARKTTAGKATGTTASAGKTTARQTTARKAPARKAPARKAPARKAPARKATSSA
ncbi:MAG: hypothetical protein ABJA87_02715 [bacterium]